MEKYISIIVDGKQLHARHFASFSEVEGPKKIIADGITKDKEWAKQAYAACVKAVKDSEPKPEKKKAHVNDKQTAAEPGAGEPK